jgi:hypothetical protein
VLIRLQGQHAVRVCDLHAAGSVLFVYQEHIYGLTA